MPHSVLVPLRPALALVAVVAGVACARRPSPPPVVAPVTPRPSPAPTAPGPTPPPGAIALLRKALEREDMRIRVRLPLGSRIAMVPGATPATWQFRCRCYAYVPASTWPWVFEAVGTVETSRGRVTLTGLTPPPDWPPGSQPSPVALSPATAPLEAP